MEENKKETKTEEKKVVDTKATEVKKEEKKVADKKQAEVKKEEKKPADKKVAETKKEEKKTVEKKTTEPKKEKKNNKVAIIGAVIVVIALLVVLAGMFLMPETPKKVVENALTELRNGSYEANMLSGLLQGEDNFNAEAQKLLFEKLEWKVLEEKEEADKATVEVEITNKDFKTIIGNYMQKVLKVAFSGKNMTEEEMTNYLMEELRNEEVENVTNKNTISLEKKDGKWEIVEEDSFINAVLPGLYEAVNSLEQ